MRIVIQRVSHASVTVDNEIVGKIGEGILILLGVADGDTEEDIKYLADKALGLRIFRDANDKMNLSVADIGGEVLVVSQFTLYGDCKKGKRPSFDKAGKPDFAEEMYEKFLDYVKKTFGKVEHGIFGADMKVDLLNNGPVTLIIDSKPKKIPTE
ncbi:MAG: D-tyrosyl-tRNA(Tyr) deacylase [Eubacteriales bacterium]|nr:D-tyrosyl-tRNA(Tyr) deacylase [Eubacteriales bacterium]